jgi:membrane-bound lytic murein transglycosylase D
MQKEALDLCQSAEQQLDRGEMDEAIASVDRAYELMLSLPNNGDGVYLQAKEDIRRLVAKIVLRLYARRASTAAPLTSWDLGLPIVDNDHVRREIKKLTTVEWNEFVAGYRRSGQYRPMILAKLRAAGLPSQLSWLPLVESWFKVRALSRAGAFGLWQFIASTALRYGLSRDRWIDERLDPEKSTDAAIAYLTELHGLFGDWPKALAAYNCGEARVLRLQGRSSDRYYDFWDLYERLPFETRRYVPRLIAALLIIENPGKYGVTLPKPLAPTDGWTRVRVERSIALDRLDQSLGLEKGTLRALNPELRRGGTPARAYDLKVPKERQEHVAAAVARLPVWRPPVPRYVIHRVRRGQTLSQIARRYRTSVSAIMRLNRIRNRNRIWPGQRLRIPRGRYR